MLLDELNAYSPGSQRTLAEAVTELKGRRAEFIVIDTPPHDQPIINIAAEAADAALIVTQPYPDDLQEVGVAAAILHRIGKAAGIVLNNTPARAHALTMARAALTAFPMPTCPTAITHLMSHPYASAEGQTAQEREPKGDSGKALPWPSSAERRRNVCIADGSANLNYQFAL